MALIDKLFDGNLDRDAFAAALWFWSRGKLTRQQVINGLGLDASDEEQLDILKQNYLYRTEEEQQAFHSDLTAAGILMVLGKISKTKYRELLDLD